MPSRRPLPVLLLLLLGTLAPAADSVIRIMPLGDSITQGNAEHLGYRRPLWRLLKQAGYAVDFVGSERAQNGGAEATQTDFDHDHEGHWGWKLSDILRMVDGYLATAKPDVVLVFLGTNDAAQGRNADDICADHLRLIGRLRAANPAVTILLAQIYTEWGGIGEVNRRLPDLVAKVATPQSRIILVDTRPGFTIAANADTFDGCHPNAAGADKLARCWFTSLQSVLPKPTQATPSGTKP